MSLSALIRPGGLQAVATLTVATLATHAAKRGTFGPTVATVATVTVANSPGSDYDPDRWCRPHSDAMNSAEIALFIDRVALCIAQGMTEAQAEAMADSLVQRDRHPEDWREAFEERAAIMEFDAGLSRDDADAEARACVTCEFQSRRKTCLEPVLAGLAPHFSIRFTEQVPGAGAACGAYKGRP